MHPPHTGKYSLLIKLGDYPRNLVELKKITINNYIVVIYLVPLEFKENIFQIPNEDNVNDEELIIKYDQFVYEVVKISIMRK